MENWQNSQSTLKKPKKYNTFAKRHDKTHQSQSTLKNLKYITLLLKGALMPTKLTIYFKNT